jgi:acetyl esterase
VASRAHEIGADAERLFLAGESAGANLACGLAVALSWRREERWARALFEAGIQPRGVLPYCGMLQVTDSGRFGRRRRLHWFVDDRLREVEDTYLQGARGPESEIADPLLVLERATPPERPLPPFFVSVGTKDPLLDDSRRLGAALERLGTPCELRVYPGEMHAFHALIWRSAARRCWRDSFDFLRRAGAG